MTVAGVGDGGSAMGDGHDVTRSQCNKDKGLVVRGVEHGEQG